MMCYLSPQVLPETFNRIELRRIRWQCDQLDLLRMSSEQGQHRFGKMNAIGINHHVDFPSNNTVGWLKHLGEHRAEQGIILVLAGGPVQLAADPMDEPCPIAFLILARRFDFALMAALAPTARDRGQQSQVNLIFVVQIDFSCLCLALQRFDAASLAVIFRIGTGNRQDRPKQLIAIRVQIMTNPAFIQPNPGFFSQIREPRKGAVQFEKAQPNVLGSCSMIERSRFK